MNHAALLVDALIALNLGLASQVHCIGMCGGVIGALSYAVEPRQVERRGMLPFALAYNAGRITSYLVAGMCIGLAGDRILALWPGAAAHLWLRLAAGAVIVLAGLSLLGVRTPGVALERTGQRLWRLLARPGRRLLPLATLRAAWAFGLLWGWLPCALVYATLLFVATGADPLRGGVVMLAFGLGTSPALVLAATVARRGGGLLRRPAWRRGAGAALILIGIAYPMLHSLLGGHGGHEGHGVHGTHAGHAATMGADTGHHSGHHSGHDAAADPAEDVVPATPFPPHAHH